MDNHVQVVEILVAHDDEDDRFLMEEALEENDCGAVYFVEDGEELMDYLYHRGQYSSLSSSPRPHLILLDLNMPRKDGREALKEIKEDQELRKMPQLRLQQLEWAGKLGIPFTTGLLLGIGERE